jgi:hypothetical protein
MDPFPPEIWTLIFNFLTTDELEIMREQCKYFYNLITDNRLFSRRIEGRKLAYRKLPWNQFKWAVEHGYHEILDELPLPRTEFEMGYIFCRSVKDSKNQLELPQKIWRIFYVETEEKLSQVIRTDSIGIATELNYFKVVEWLKTLPFCKPLSDKDLIIKALKGGGIPLSAVSKPIKLNL